MGQIQEVIAKIIRLSMKRIFHGPVVIQQLDIVRV